MISALAFVPKGKAKSVPDRDAPDEAELEALKTQALETGALEDDAMDQDGDWETDSDEDDVEEAVRHCLPMSAICGQLAARARQLAASRGPHSLCNQAGRASPSDGSHCQQQLRTCSIRFGERNEEARHGQLR